LTFAAIRPDVALSALEHEDKAVNMAISKDRDRILTMVDTFVRRVRAG
jgi:hypothetical protein